MKLKTLLISSLMGLSLAACNDSSDISGTYSNDDKQNLTIEKSKDGQKFVVSTKISVKSMLGDGEKLAPYKIVTYKKDNALYDLSDDSLVGKIEKDDFTLLKNNKVYKKKL
ncbi:TPA: hypothetical protein ACPO1V_001739 [Haemophilus influenzae]|uniref:hypothetical protein n=1 Tax=Haemophilus influenzae TaxID=727 RepID=UPI000DD44F1C|nr:hypothetical protein [Haemophilus influenzae]